MPELDPKRSLQEMMLALEVYWSARGCVIQQPYPSEVGAGTFNPATFLRSLGPEPWKVAFEITEDPTYPLYEYACHEGNYALVNILKGARAAERAAQKSRGEL